MSWILWLIGVAIVAIVGLATFGIFDLHAVTDQLRNFQDGLAKALIVGAGLIAISKFF